MAPVQEAAVPLDEALAVFTTFNCKVSELARPIGAELDSTAAVELVVVVVLRTEINPETLPGLADLYFLNGGLLRP
jgi:hypothetical protein